VQVGVSCSFVCPLLVPYAVSGRSTTANETEHLRSYLPVRVGPLDAQNCITRSKTNNCSQNRREH
jgi:hypothetical protein